MFDAILHDLSRYFMRFTERDSPCYEVIRHIGRSQKIGPQLFIQMFFCKCRMNQNMRENEKTLPRRLDGFEHRLFIFLHIPVVSERKSFHGR